MEAEAHGWHERVANLGRGWATAHGRQEKMVAPADFHEFWSSIRALRTQSALPEGLRVQTKLQVRINAAPTYKITRFSDHDVIKWVRYIGRSGLYETRC